MGEIIFKDVNFKKVDIIEQWIDFMFIFVGIYFSGYFVKFIEFLKYMQCVRMGVNRGVVGWKEYDVQYRLCKVYNLVLLWGEVDFEFWLMYMILILIVNVF